MGYRYSVVGQWYTLRGPTLLREWFDRPDSPTQRQIATRLQVSYGLVYWWKIGEKRPGSVLRLALERIAGIPVDAWLTPRERLREKRMRAA